MVFFRLEWSSSGSLARKTIERRLATRPPITVPSMVLRGGDDHVTPSRFSANDMSRFPSGTVRRVVDGVGHFMPREKPGEVVDALVKVLG